MSSSSRKGEKVDSGSVRDDLDVRKVPDLNIKEVPDVVLGGENSKCCYEVSKNSGQDESRFMEFELEGDKSGFGSLKFSEDCSLVTIHGVEEKIGDFCAVLTEIADAGVDRKEKQVEGSDFTIVATNELMFSNSQPLENLKSTDVSDSGGLIEGDEKGDSIEVSACKFDKEEKCEIVKMEASEERGVQVVGKVLRSRIVPANVPGEISGSGKSKLSELKRKRGTNGSGEGAVIVKEEVEDLAAESERVPKRGRPKKSDDHLQGEDVNVKLVKTRKKKGKRGRPKKLVDHPEEEVLQLNNVPFISEDEDEEMSNNSGISVKQNGKRGRRKKFLTNKFQVLSEVEDENLNSMSVRSSNKKRKRGRPRKSLDCSDGEFDCVVSDGANKKIFGNSEPKRKRGRPRKSDACPGEEVIQMKVSFDEVDDKLENGKERLSKKSVKNSKKKQKRGRPRKEVGSDAVKATFHDKNKVKNGRKMKVSLEAAPIRRTRLTNPEKIPSMKGHLSDGEISADEPGPGTKVVLTSPKGQEKPLSKNNSTKKQKNFDKLGSPSAEKNLIRNQIVKMLLAAGWTVEYRPRQGREYNDAVYVNQDGKTHWSVTKAYFNLKREFEEGKLASEAGKSNFCFTPVPEEILSKLFRVVSKTRSDKNKKKKHGEGHSGIKRKPSIRSGSQNKRRNALVVRLSKNSESDVFTAHSGKHSIFAWMIDSATVPLDAKVYYMNRRKTRAMLEGNVTRDGIHCNCCKEVMSAYDFEKHAGSNLCEPYENTYLENGSSLLQCQLDSWRKQEETGRSGFHNVRVDGGEDPNDDTCGICGDGGDLVCCDGCPSTFHNDCLDVEELPSGEWHCVYCSCKFCGGVSEAASESDDDCEPLSSLLISCSLCEEKYHQSCIDDEDVCIESRHLSFCGKNCEQVFTGLQSLVGAKRDLGDGFSCTLLQRSDVEGDVSALRSQNIQNNSKLAITLSVMDECFVPILDHRSGINLIRHIVYGYGSNFKRLDFRSYFTVLLEKGDEVISVASIRIRGKKLAEMPFIGTRNVYRRQGMCRRLLDAIELVLVSLDVENLVIPAISELMQTWTTVFGFKPLEESLKEEIRSMSLLVFPHTDMLQKSIPSPATGEDINCVKSEVDNNVKFDLNSEATTNLSENSSPDEVLPGNKVADQEAQKPDNVAVNQDRSSPKEKTLKFDLNLVEENVPEISKNPSD